MRTKDTKLPTKRTKTNLLTLVIELFLPPAPVAKVSDLRSRVGSCHLLLLHSEFAQSGTPLDWRSWSCIRFLSTSPDRFELLSVCIFFICPRAFSSLSEGFRCDYFHDILTSLALSSEILQSRTQNAADRAKM